MRRIIDLSHPITDGMPVFPGDPGVQFERTASIGQGGYNVTRITIGSHTGTHVDVPHHCIRDERTVDRIDLEALAGWAEIVDLGKLPAGHEITAADLDLYGSRIGEGARVLLRTDWSRFWGKEQFFAEFPSLTEGAAAWLVSRKVRLLAIEQPSVSREHHLEVHRALLSTGTVLIESIANLDQITADRVWLVALPLNLAGLDGAPVRAVAIEGEPGT